MAVFELKMSTEFPRRVARAQLRLGEACHADRDVDEWRDPPNRVRGEAERGCERDRVHAFFGVVVRRRIGGKRCGRQPQSEAGSNPRMLTTIHNVAMTTLTGTRRQLQILFVYSLHGEVQTTQGSAGGEPVPDPARTRPRTGRYADHSVSAAARRGARVGASPLFDPP